MRPVNRKKKSAHLQAEKRIEAHKKALEGTKIEIVFYEISHVSVNGLRIKEVAECNLGKSFLPVGRQEFPFYPMLYDQAEGDDLRNKSAEF